jgi:hypothetical protein
MLKYWMYIRHVELGGTRGVTHDVCICVYFLEKNMFRPTHQNGVYANTQNLGLTTLVYMRILFILAPYPSNSCHIHPIGDITVSVVWMAAG